jgi:predicted acetyltransferase
MIRHATERDIVELAELWTRAFPGSRSVEERVRHLETGGVFGGIETVWVAERAERLAGAYRGFALTQHMHGTAYRMMGLAAVAVDETARRRGVGRALCEHSVHVARERGDVLGVLYPFRPAFYDALGWGLVGELHAHRFTPESLITVRDGDVRLATEDDARAIGACYARVAVETNGMITRTPRIWRSHLQAAGTYAYITGADRVRGYALVRFGRGGPPDERPLYLRELIAEDHEAYEVLLGWVAAQRDMWRIVHYDAAPDERFAHRLREPRPPGYTAARSLWAPVARVIRGPMLRIIDVQKALEQRARWGASSPLRFTLQLHDPLVPENEGPFVVDYDGARATLRRDVPVAVSSQPGNGGRPALRIGAAMFAKVFAGELSVQDALNLGAECDGDASTIDALFRVDRCFRLLDEF